MYDLHSLHHEANEAFARRLFDGLPAMRGKLGYISQAIQSDAGGPSLRPDTAQGGIEPGRDSGGDSGTQGVRVAV